MDLHTKEEHTHQTMKTGAKAMVGGAMLASFTAAKLAAFLIEKLSEKYKGKDKEENPIDTVDIKINGKTLYKADFKDGKPLKPSIDELSETHTAYLAAIMGKSKGSTIPSKDSIDVEINGQKAFSTDNGKVTTNGLPVEFSKAFESTIDKTPPLPEYMDLAKIDLSKQQLSEVVSKYPQIGETIDQQVAANALQQGIQVDDIKKILQTSPSVNELARKGQTMEQVSKDYIAPLIAGVQKENAPATKPEPVAQPATSPQPTPIAPEAAAKLEEMGINAQNVQQEVASQVKAGSVSPIIVIQQQVNQLPQSGLKDKLSNFFAKVAELPRKVVEAGKKMGAEFEAERKADLAPQDLRVSQTIEVLVERYGKDQSNGDRTLDFGGAYSMKRTQQGGLVLSHSQRGNIFSLAEGKLQSKLNTGDVERFNTFQKDLERSINLSVQSKQNPVLARGGR
jgi:hypothetical protein